MDDNWVRELIMFVLFWIVGLCIWAIWIDGVYVPLFGFCTAVLFRLVMTLDYVIDKKKLK